MGAIIDWMRASEVGRSLNSEEERRKGDGVISVVVSVFFGFFFRTLSLSLEKKKPNAPAAVYALLDAPRASRFGLGFEDIQNESCASVEAKCALPSAAFRSAEAPSSIDDEDTGTLALRRHRRRNRNRSTTTSSTRRRRRRAASPSAPAPRPPAGLARPGSGALARISHHLVLYQEEGGRGVSSSS